MQPDFEKLPEPYLNWPNDGGFYVEDDVLEPVELKVTGHIPAYAAGTLYRTGPCANKVKNISTGGDFNLSHWFDGFSQTHRFELIPDAASASGMKVTYNSRRQVDGLVEKIRATGRFDQMSFGQKRDPCDGLFQKFKTAFQMPTELPCEFNNIGVTIAPDVPGIHPPKTERAPSHTNGATSQPSARLKSLTTFTDRVGFKHIDPETLEPLGVATQASLHPSLTGPLSAAHANFCPTTGDVLNYNLDFTLPTATYRIWKTDRKTEETEILATIKDPDAACAYLHSSFITQNFFILPIWASHMGKGGLSILWERSVCASILPFSSDRKTIWLVIDRTGSRGLVAKFESPAGFSFHNSNAWEERNEDGTTDLILDLVEYSNLDIIHQFYYKNFLSSSAAAPIYKAEHAEGIKSHFRRYKLAGVPTTDTPEVPLEVKQAEVLIHHESPKTGEFPVINSTFHTRPNRYLYTVLDTGKSSFFDSLSKLDILTGESTTFCIPHHTPGEPIFVANPDGQDEDDGTLLVVMYDGDTGGSYLLALDARTMKELGRADVGGTVGFGFHGRHVGMGGVVSGPAAETGGGQMAG